MIYEINYSELNNYFLISITESDLVENIFINNNVWIKDDLLIENLNSKVNSLTKNNIKDDIKIIKNIYKSEVFKIFLCLPKLRNIQDRSNIIFEINENEQKKLMSLNLLEMIFFLIII